ncbi:hypothetical protein ACOSQ2_031238 [Xanthoceras sorbifolium]
MKPTISKEERKGTNLEEKAKEVVLGFLRNEAVMSEVAAAQALVAKGTKINEINKDGIFTALEKFSTLYISGSARTTDNIATPITIYITPLNQAHIDLLTSLLLFSSSTNLSVSSHVLDTYMSVELN